MRPLLYLFKAIAFHTTIRQTPYAEQILDRLSPLLCNSPGCIASIFLNGNSVGRRTAAEGLDLKNSGTVPGFFQNEKSRHSGLWDAARFGRLFRLFGFRRVRAAVGRWLD